MDRGHRRAETPVFCKVKLLFMSKESGSLEERIDGYNSFNFPSEKADGKVKARW